MKNIGLISVVVPVYNTAPVLRRCVDGILAQRYKDIEVLLVDDGSTDGSGDILDEYAAKDPRCRVFHKPNGGVSSARNMALDNLSPRSAFIAFCDSDDYVADTWLLDYAENHGGEDVLCQNPRWFVGQGRVRDFDVSVTDNMTLAEKIKLLYSQNILISACFAIWKTEIVKANKLRFGNYVIAEDANWSVEYCHFACSVSIVPQVLCHQYGYHYYYPWFGRQYFLVNKRLFETRVDLFNRLYSLFSLLDAEPLFGEINKAVSSGTIVGLMDMYRGNNTSVATRRERLEILEVIHGCKAKMKYAGGPMVYLYGFVANTLPEQVADIVLFVLTRIFYAGNGRGFSRFRLLRERKRHC